VRKYQDKYFSFTYEDLVNWLGQKIITRGETYLREGRVERAEYEYPTLAAIVNGDAGQSYKVRAEITRHGILGVCSCSQGHNCEHVAAASLKILEIFQMPERRDEVVSPYLLAWLTELRQIARSDGAPPRKRKGAPPARLFYRLEISPNTVLLYIQKGNSLKLARNWSLTERALVAPPKFVSENDLPILRRLWSLQRKSYTNRYGDNGDDDDYYDDIYGDYYGDASIMLPPRTNIGDLLELLIDSERLGADRMEEVLKKGAPRPARIAWKPGSGGSQRPKVEVDAAIAASTQVLPLLPPWYLDRSTGELGPLEVALPAAFVEKFLTLQPISRREAALVAETLAEISPQAPLPLSDPKTACRVLTGPPLGELQLDTLDGVYMQQQAGGSYKSSKFDYATIAFLYGEAHVPPGDMREYITLKSSEVVRLQRDHKAEKKLVQTLLKSFDFHSTPSHRLYFLPDRMHPTEIYTLPSEENWLHFMQNRKKLEQSGWRLLFKPGFRHHYLEVESWEADIDETGEGWLSLDLGVVVEGERLALAPLLADLFRREPRWLNAYTLASIPPEEPVTLMTEDERRLRVPAGRLQPIVHVLIDLFAGSGYENGPLQLSRWDAARLDEFQDQSRWKFKGPEAVIRLAERLRNSHGVQDVAPPQGLRLALRDYQRAGLAWLQYLREQDLAGILADDMGLGKTAQALAHILLEKEAGRLDAPVLAVLPTSLVFNWKNETARFAPSLKVLSLYGKERKERFAEIPGHDIVLTTYPLLWRDGEALGRHEYHMLILDEAQTVKNFRSKSAETVRQIKARYRLCLTGTPLENHLGELWAQFDFLLPGFLGSHKDFVRIWRTPIEKQGDTLRRDLLARRLRPFILRRKKDEVAAELPPKTITVRTVELSGTQRDLYETVRAAMDEKVRAEIASKGFKRSQIVILDALLKLRQVCCDPRLIKSATAKKIKERAKLNLLMDMLPELVDEGRRILVFSQFTAMLDLIEAELLGLQIPHVRLDGETRDRETQVKTFQEGKAPVFLISLKAGGVGLNLTAADTVIHYDPWWNPAVENQATDRAHRLGQDKPVFVYKLIAAGSIEEKILALQERKAALAASILAEGHQGDIKFSEADIAALFEPLPEADR
jgi:superfamily II DNA or RNA helicase